MSDLSCGHFICVILVYLLILTNETSYKNLRMMQNTFPVINKIIKPVPKLLVDPENTTEVARNGLLSERMVCCLHQRLEDA